MKALVTGGAGFTGRHLVERLVSDGNTVVTLDLPGPALDSVAECGAETSGCDLCSGAGLDECMEGVDVVFHVAAFASPWGSHEKFWSVNVNGTENVIKAAKKAGVSRMVHVSSTSAVFDGYTHHDKIDETFPYPTRFLSPYSSSKCVSERMVLAANCPSFETAAVRPHLIWGPRDQTFLKRVIEHAKNGPIFHIGGGKTMTDNTYVDNLVEGMVLAAKSDKAPGNAYFITNGEPMSYGDFIDRVLEIFELPPAKGSIPAPLANAAGSVIDVIWPLFKIQREPLLSRYKLAELLYTHTYSIDKANRDLGYDPPVNNEEGFKRLEAWAREEGAP